MDADEIRFRLACEARKTLGVVRARVSPPQWRRRDLAKALAPAAPDDSTSLRAARQALASADFSSVHTQLARHFSERDPRFPLDPRMLADIVERVRLRFPDATADARSRADRIVEGSYDLLGYEGIQFGATPAWNRDPVHGRRAPRTYWSSIRYLDRRYGDHKIIWEINRHQHWLALARAYYLTADHRYYDAVVRQLESWMIANPPHRGVNWASMLELGLRAISWTWALHFFAPLATASSADDPWVVDLLVGLDRQLQHVENNLSLYFSPNTHLLGEALALYVVSAALPELRASARRVALGRRVLIDELDRQVNADGGHAELSAHYHRYATDFYLLASLSARVTVDPAAAAFEDGARKLALYLRAICDDEGQLPLIGDDDGGRLFPMCAREPFDCRDTLAAAAAILGEPTLLVSDVPEEVFWLCGMLPLEQLAWRPQPWPSTALPDSGYYVSRTPRHDHLVFDAGRHGFLNGGHAHADALAVVLTVGGRPLLVDSGTATYTMDAALRDRLRTTAMHNTVVVNGRSQSEPQGPFHWRTTTDARAPLWISDVAFDYAEGNHDAYAPIVHSRSVLAVHDVGWIVIDHLLGDGTARAEAFWHLHPGWSAHQEHGRTTLRHRDGAVLTIASSLPLEILGPGAPGGLAAYAPVYGRVERGTCIRARVDAAVPVTFATFVPNERCIKAEPGATAEIAAVAITQAPPAGWHAAAFKVTVARYEALVLAAIERTPHATAASPGALWGTNTVRTDARMALTCLSGQHRPPILIHGSQLETVAGLVRA
jgi:hypothetical protein